MISENKENIVIKKSSLYTGLAIVIVSVIVATLLILPGLREQNKLNETVHNEVSSLRSRVSLLEAQVNSITTELNK